MEQINFSEYSRAAHFGHRKLTPRACVVDSKKHLRLFLSDALEDLGFVTCECGQAGDLAGLLQTEQPDLIVLSVCVDGINVGEILEAIVRKNFGGKVLVIGQPELDHGEGRQANRRRIRHRHAALAADAVRRGEPARQRRGVAAGRAGAEPGRRCRRGPEGRLARIVVPAEDRHPLAGAQRRGGAGADAASRLGRGPAGLFHSRRQGSAFSHAVRIRGRSRHRGLALSAGEPGSGRSLDQPAGIVLRRRRGGTRSLPRHARPPRLRRTPDRNQQQRGDRPSGPGGGRRKTAAPAQYRDRHRQCRRGMAVAAGASELSVRRAQGRPAIHQRLRGRPAEADGMPAHRRTGPGQRRPRHRPGHRDPRRFSRRARHGVRPGPGPPVRQAGGGTEIRPLAPSARCRRRQDRPERELTRTSCRCISRCRSRGRTR